MSGADGRSLQLRRKIALASGGLKAASLSLWTHPRLPEIYPHALVTTHSIVRATVPLMERGRARAREAAGGDSLCAALAAYFEKHIPEETGHDDWVLDDLEALGHERTEATSGLTSPTSAALVGAQYYWIDHVHPASLLGYIAVLEGDPPVEVEIRRAIERSGLPAAAFGTLLKHARLDPYHRAELDAAIDEMPWGEREWRVVGVSALQSVALLAQVLEEIVRFA